MEDFDESKCLTFAPLGFSLNEDLQRAQYRKPRYRMIQRRQQLVKSILDSYGFEQCSSSVSAADLIWSPNRLRYSFLKKLKPRQRWNHFPGSSELTNKDRLYKNIASFSSSFGTALDFIPKFFILPEEIDTVKRELEKKNLLILKPFSAARGDGISIARKVEDLPNDSKLLASHYISNPLLIDGYKFDLRIYVLVTSFIPLTAYLYKEGFARFATKKFAGFSTRHKTAHLTNYSINKRSKSFLHNTSATVDNFGHKWTLSALLRKLKSLNVDTNLVMVRIEDLIVKTLLSARGNLTKKFESANFHLASPPHRSCFELFGFDVLIDENLKPWLLEVNLSPSLTCDAPVDTHVKGSLMIDVFNLVCIPLNVLKRPKISSQVSDQKKRKKKSVARNSNLNGVCSRKATLEEIKLKFRKRFEFEHSRRNNFICLFPRKNTWFLYKNLKIDDDNGENLDSLNDMIYEPYDCKADVDAISLVHKQLLNSEFKKLGDMSESVRSLLMDAYLEADTYSSPVACDFASNLAQRFASKVAFGDEKSSVMDESCARFIPIQPINIIGEANACSVENPCANDLNGSVHCVNMENADTFARGCVEYACSQVLDNCLENQSSHVLTHTMNVNDPTAVLQLKRENSSDCNESNNPSHIWFGDENLVPSECVLSQ